MSQYTPFYQSSKYPEINRRITSYEYQKVVDAAIELGLTQGFMQEKSSAKEEYTPPFELQGIWYLYKKKSFLMLFHEPEKGYR